MPPLREHKEDIETLCQVFLGEFNTQHGRTVTIGKEAINCLKQYNFPGNVRELRNIMERASVLCRGAEITPEDLPHELGELPDLAAADGTLSEKLAIVERGFLQQALIASKGNRTEAARILGISRKNLWEKMRAHALE
jgi:DNA-binding NtrC family response regulator